MPVLTISVTVWGPGDNIARTVGGWKPPFAAMPVQQRLFHAADDSVLLSEGARFKLFVPAIATAPGAGGGRKGHVRRSRQQTTVLTRASSNGHRRFRGVLC
ncbi:hypothetical protein MnTg02_00166 [bacterium MnTg02]|nr:hypothetical protein MnTg02_00166 [bacterium MnTg02]